MVAGVAAGISERTGIDITIVRIAFVVVGLMSGVGVLAYALGWLMVPIEGESTSIFTRAIHDRRGIALAAAFLPLLVFVEIIAGFLHISTLGSFSVPVFIAAAGLVLIWRNAGESEQTWMRETAAPILQIGTSPRSRWGLAVRVLAGLLILAGGLAILVTGHTSTAVLVPLAGVFLVLAACVIIFGPWWLTIFRDLASERQARVRAEERAEMASQVHDSVLQTLALIQRSADDPRHVAHLARTQERELRSWLFDGRSPGSVGTEVTTLAQGVEAIEREVEDDHTIAVHAVTVGDCELTDELRALLAAGKEAAVNAAKWSGTSEVSLFAEVEQDVVTLCVRDRGAGFDPDAVPADRKGIAESIRARMARQGGSAVIRSAPGEGAEVALSMPRHVNAR